MIGHWYQMIAIDYFKKETRKEKVLSSNRKDFSHFSLGSVATFRQASQNINEVPPEYHRWTLYVDASRRKKIWDTQELKRDDCLRGAIKFETRSGTRSLNVFEEEKVFSCGKTQSENSKILFSWVRIAECWEIAPQREVTDRLLNLKFDFADSPKWSLFSLVCV